MSVVDTRANAHTRARVAADVEPALTAARRLPPSARLGIAVESKARAELHRRRPRRLTR